MARVTVHYYDRTATKIVRTHTYATRAAARRAMTRAIRRCQPCSFAGRRTERDQPTVHS